MGRQGDIEGDGMKSHLLVDYDSTIPNFALMKISAWVKQHGDIVYLNETEQDPDEIWLSCIFTWNRSRAEMAISLFRARFPNANIHFGGTGFDWGRIGNRIKLPPEIEMMHPDYSLYDDDRAVTFTERGCIRKCEFCDVWRKEGTPNSYHRLRDWVPDGFRKVLELGNEIAASSHHDEILQDAVDMGLKISLTQGYDIRLVTEDKAGLLAENKPYDLNFRERQLYFSWDYPQNENWIRRGIPMLLDAGFKGRELVCYVLVGHRSTFEQDVYRARTLRNEFGVLTYIMPYNNRKDDQNLNNLRRWANRRQLYKSMDFPEYDVHFRKQEKALP